MSNSKKIAISSMLAILNILGAFLALSFKLPIYLDSIGTISCAKVLGLKYAILTATVSALINFTYDTYAIYYLPVAIIIAIMVYICELESFKNSHILIKTFIITIIPAIVAAIITAKVFGGITSSGSSIILQFLTKLGMPMSLSAFVVQLPTDFLDKFISILLSNKIYKMILKAK